MGIKNISESAVWHVPEYAPVKENEQVLLALGITADHIAALPMIVNTGAVFLLLEVRKPEILQSLRPVAATMELLADQYNLAGFCVFFRQDGKQADAIARTFPVFAAGQEAAPGVPAAGALACYLYDIAMIKKETMILLHDFPHAPATARIVVRLHTQQGKIVSLEPENLEPVQ